MNTTEPSTPASTGLPALSDERAEDIRAQIFSQIDAERTRDQARAARRGRWWMGGAAAAAVVAIAAIIAPSVTSGIVSSSGVTSTAVDASAPLTDTGGGAGAPEPASGLSVDGTAGSGAVTLESNKAVGADASASGARDIVASASATVTVDDVSTATEQVGDRAAALGGYTESLSIGANQPVMPMDGRMSVDGPTTVTAPTDGWITVRVPADQLQSMLDELRTLGEVTSSSTNRYDVTGQVVDVEARLASAQTSVARLRELVSQATSTADLIAAETALAERQAEAESLQAQLTMLNEQVAMSSLNVTLQTRYAPVTADPAGFWDGLVAGWNGLVASVNGVVVALGFLIPWLLVVAVIGGVVWGIRTLVRRPRRRTGTSTGDDNQD